MTDYTVSFPCGCTVTFLGSCFHRSSRMECCAQHNGRDDVEARNSIHRAAKQDFRRLTGDSHLKRVMRAMLAILIGATIGASAAQADCRPVIRSRFVHHAVVVEPVLAAQFVGVPYNLPAYSVGLSAPQLDLTPLVEELRLLRATVQQLRAPGSAGVNPGEIDELPPEPEYVGLVRQNCASCHGIQPKGNKLTFFDSAGRFREPGPELLGTLIAAVSSGSMPKGGRMEPGDRLKLISGLTTAPEAAAKMPPGK